MQKSRSAWQPQITRHSSEQSIWTEDAYHRVLVNFASAVEEEIKKQQEEVTVVRAQVEMEMDEERELFVLRNATRREEVEVAASTPPNHRATMMEQYQLELFDKDQKKEWEENEEALVQDCPLAFLSAETESSLSYFALLPRLKSRLAQLTQERLQKGSEDDCVVPQDESQQDPVRAGTVISQTLTPIEAAAKQIDARTRARQRMLLLRGAYCTPQGIVDARQERHDSASSAVGEPSEDVSPQKVPRSASAHSKAEKTEQLAFGELRGRAFVDAALAHSRETLRATLHRAERALETEMRRLTDRLHYAEMQLSALEGGSAMPPRKLAKTDRCASVLSDKNTGMTPSVNADAKTWRAEVAERQRELRSSPRCAGFKALIARCAQKLDQEEAASRMSTEDAQATARAVDQASHDKSSAAPDVPAAITHDTNLHLKESQLSPGLELSSPLPHKVNVLTTRIRHVLTDIVSQHGTDLNWVWHEKAWAHHDNVEESPASSASVASVEVSFLTAPHTTGPRRHRGHTEHTSVHGEVVYLLDPPATPTTETEAQAEARAKASTGVALADAAAYMEQKANDYLWPTALEARVRHVLYGVELDAESCEEWLNARAGGGDGGGDEVNPYEARGVTSHRQRASRSLLQCQLSHSDVVNCLLPLSGTPAASAATNAHKTNAKKPTMDKQGEAWGADDDSHQETHEGGVMCLYRDERGRFATTALSTSTSASPTVLDSVALLKTTIIPCARSGFESKNSDDHDNEAVHHTDVVRPICTVHTVRPSPDEGTLQNPPLAADPALPAGQSSPRAGCVACARGSLKGRLITVPRLATRAVLHVEGHGDFSASHISFDENEDVL